MVLALFLSNNQWQSHIFNFRYLYPCDERVPVCFDGSYQVVQSWLGYRMRERRGKKSSPLDDIRPKVWTYDFTKELLELLWLLEKTIEGYPAQQQLLEEVLNSDLFTAEELPPVPEELRNPPKIPKPRRGQQVAFE